MGLTMNHCLVVTLVASALAFYALVSSVVDAPSEERGPRPLAHAHPRLNADSHSQLSHLVAKFSR